MKHIKQIIYVISFFSLAVFFNSCGFCIKGPFGGQDYSNTDSVVFRFSNGTTINKVELIGTNKSINVNSTFCALTLNPSDTISGYKIYTNIRSGEVYIRNNMIIRTDTRACKDGYTLAFDPELIRTTFTKVQIAPDEYDDKKHIVEIIP